MGQICPQLAICFQGPLADPRCMDPAVMEPEVLEDQKQRTMTGELMRFEDITPVVTFLATARDCCLLSFDPGRSTP